MSFRASPMQEEKSRPLIAASEEPENWACAMRGAARARVARVGRKQDVF